jgi:putative membrane protein
MYRMNPFRWLWVGFGLLFLLVGSMWALSSFYRSTFYSGTYYRMPMMSWGGGWMMGVGVIGFVLVCFLVMVALRYTSWGPSGHRMGCGMGGVGWSGEAEEILRQRYARGEVTKEQYDQMLRDLRDGRY